LGWCCSALREGDPLKVEQQQGRLPESLEGLGLQGVANS
jgi:hypothetical protein